MLLSFQKSLLFFGVFAAFTKVSAAPKAAKANKVLDFPAEERSVETPDVKISGIASDDKRLFFVVSDRPHVIATPFSGLKPSRDESFGVLIASTRHNIADQPPLTMWQGIVYESGRLLLLDGQGLRLQSLNATDFGQVARRSIAWDLIKPAADAKGEPTRIETDQLRAKFRREYQKAGEVKLSGLANFSSGKTQKYLVGTRIAGFPVVMLSCSGEDGSMCYLERACDIPRIADMLPSSVAGVAYSKKRKMLIIGDKAKHRLHMFRFDSCFSVKRKSSVELPAKIKSLSNVYVDADDRLWVTSSSADDYLNASAYVWDNKAW